MCDKTGVSPLKYFASGAFAGACTVLVDYPIDKLKAQACKDTRIMNFRVFWDCVVTEFKKQGYKEIYKGVMEPMHAIPPVFALSFFGFGLGKRLLQGKPTDDLSLLKLFGAGAFSGFLTTTIMTQEDSIKAYFSNKFKEGSGAARSVIEDIKKVGNEQNLKGVFKGNLAMYLKDIPANGLYFMAYEGLRRSLVPCEKRNEICLLRTLIAGGCAGMAFCLVSIPADILKARMKVAPDMNVIEMGQKIVKEEGIAALYKGSAPAFVRAFPANAACFLGFETCKKFLDWIFPNPL